MKKFVIIAVLFCSCKTKEAVNYGWKKSDFIFLNDTTKTK